MYMVIVMEYFPKGHLGNIVQNAREKKQPIPEEVRSLVTLDKSHISIPLIYKKREIFHTSC